MADAYAAQTGVRIRWCSEEEYLQRRAQFATPPLRWMWSYDRKFNRDIDCSKILRVTGLTAADLCSVEVGIATELARIKEEQ